MTQPRWDLRAYETLTAAESDRNYLAQVILDLQEVLNAGETSTSIDGTTTSVDLDVVRQQLAIARRRLDELTGAAQRKPRISSIRAGGLF